MDFKPNGILRGGKFVHRRRIQGGGVTLLCNTAYNYGGIATDNPVTCKKCLKMIAAQERRENKRTMPNRCPCDDCSGLEGPCAVPVCPLKAVRVEVEAIRGVAKTMRHYGHGGGFIDNLDGAIQAAFDAMEE